MQTKKLFTVIACRWFDKTYHSVRCIRHSDGAVIVHAWTYGYDSAYEQTAYDTMYKAGWFKNYRRKVLAPSNNPAKFVSVGYKKATIRMFDRENNYPIIWTVSDGLKRDMVANGVI